MFKFKRDSYCSYMPQLIIARPTCKIPKICCENPQREHRASRNKHTAKTEKISSICQELVSRLQKKPRRHVAASYSTKNRMRRG